MVTITVEDSATPELRAEMARLTDRKPLHAEMGMAVERLVARHLRATKLPQGNRLGAPSTGFWKKAIDSVVGTANATEAVVSIPSRGVALQYYGGTVKPQRAEYLTIPIHAVAHGKSVAELGLPVYRFLSKKGNWLLAEDPRGGRKGDGSRRKSAGPPRYRGGQPLYLLRKRATIRPHPDVLPSEAEIAATAHEAATKYIARRLPL